MKFRAEVTEVVVEALRRAQDEARALGHGYIGTEHLLIACTQEAESRGAAVIRAQGISTDAVREETRRIFAENNWNAYLPDEEALSAVGVDLAAVRSQVEAEFGTERSRCEAHPASLAACGECWRRRARAPRNPPAVRPA